MRLSALSDLIIIAAGVAFASHAFAVLAALAGVGR
jgi:hypothetical protein